MQIPYRTQRAIKRVLLAILITVLVLSAAAACWIIWLGRFVVYDREKGAWFDMDQSSVEMDGEPMMERTDIPKVEIFYNEGENAIVTATDLTQLTGYYITGEDLKKDVTEIQAQLEQLPDGTPVMLDVKSIYGNFYYNSVVGEYRDPAISSTAVDQLIKYMNSSGLYTIARLPAFRDYNFGLNNVEYGLPTSGGYLWTDDTYCYWLNPSSQGTRSYLISIIAELKNLGFDEVVLTEFRFPVSDQIVFSGDRVQAVNDCAKVLVDTCSTEAFTVSFVSADQFVLPEGRTRIYLENAQPAMAAALAAGTGLEKPEIYVVFITELHDTRFNEFSVLRPLSAAH